MLTIEAPAKINLTLEILRKRDDGYHEIASVMQAVSLCDTLTFELASDTTLDCDDATLATEDNLALKAAHLLSAHTGYSGGVRIGLVKGIPVAAGLGGGSSDAAATLVALNNLWNLGLPLAELSLMAASVGSDVPFFLHGGVAMVSGRGELVRPLPAIGVDWAVIVTPAITVARRRQTRSLRLRLRATRLGT